MTADAVVKLGAGCDPIIIYFVKEWLGECVYEEQDLVSVLQHSTLLIHLHFLPDKTASLKHLL